MSSKKRKNLNRKILILGAIIILFLTIRVVGLQESIQFGSDEGRDFLKVWDIYNTKEVTLIGPPSQYNINGREFFFGPAPYYTILPALVLGNWNPIIVSYYIVLLNASVLLLALLLLEKYHKEKRVIYSFGFLTAVTPAFVSYTQSYWNPHFMLPVSILLLALLVKSRVSSSLLLFFFIGFLFGLGMQFHYSFIFAILIGFVWLLINRRVTWRVLAVVLAGGIVGFMPVIIFELRNNFYNLNTFLLALNNSSTTFEGAKVQPFYLISVFPFLIYLASIILAKVKNNLLFIGLLFIYTIFSFIVILSSPKPKLSYPTLEKMSSIIKKDNPVNYNIVDQLTQDNRAMALRYLLTVSGAEPQRVEAYPDAKTLYIYSKLPLEKLLIDPVWEIKSFLPFTNVTTVKVNDEINIYKLEK